MKKPDRPASNRRPKTDGARPNIKKIEQVIRRNLGVVGRSNKEKAKAYRVIGQQLDKAKKALPRGGYLLWAKMEFGWTRQHCARYVQLAKLPLPKVVERMEHGYSIWVQPPTMMASKVGIAEKTGHVLAAATASRHPDYREPDSLTALQRVIGSTRQFAKDFPTEKVAEAATQQADTLGPEKLNDLIDKTDEQRDFWNELSIALRKAKVVREKARRALAVG